MPITHVKATSPTGAEIFVPVDKTIQDAIDLMAILEPEHPDDVYDLDRIITNLTIIKDWFRKEDDRKDG